MVFVHNIDTGPVAGVKSSLQRLRSPDDAPCALCALTRGVRGTNPSWQRYVDALPDPAHVVNRDQWRADHASSSWRNIDLPAVLLQTGSKIEKLVGAKEIRKSATLKDLMNKIDEALLAHPPEDRTFSRGEQS